MHWLFQECELPSKAICEEGQISQGGDEQVAGTRTVAQPVDTMPHAGCSSLKQLSVYQATHVLWVINSPPKRTPGGLQQLGEAPHTDTPELVPRTP